MIEEDKNLDRDQLLKRYSGHLPEHIKLMLIKRESLKKARAVRAANRAQQETTE